MKLEKTFSRAIERQQEQLCYFPVEFWETEYTTVSYHHGKDSTVERPFCDSIMTRPWIRSCSTPTNVFASMTQPK
jgi:hypothetical protein